MRKPGADAAQITPTPSGWRLQFGSAPARAAGALGELVPEIPARAHVELALPTYAALLERLTLPATDREELMGMVQLHLEKTLPYPVEETTNGFEIIRQDENETTLLAIAVHGPVLAQLCQPLRDAERVPTRLSLFALDLASVVPAEGRVAAVWAEQKHLAIAIYEQGRLCWAYSLVGMDETTLRSDLPPLLLTAEVEGVPTDLQSVALAADCAGLAEALRAIFAVPVTMFAVGEVRPARVLNLLPPDWANAATVLERQERLQQRLMMAAVAYLLLVACAFVYLAWTKRRLQVLEAELLRIQPAIRTTQQQQARLLALAPALEQKAYAVELLYLVHKNRPPEVHITQLNTAPDQFVVKGEASNAGQAVDFSQKLASEFGKENVQSPAPKILPNNHAQFSIFGKR